MLDQVEQQAAVRRERGLGALEADVKQRFPHLLEPSTAIQDACSELAMPMDCTCTNQYPTRMVTE